MKHIGILMVLCAIGSAAPAEEQRQASTFYKIDDFYAGSGPKSSFTSYSFEIGIITESGAMISQTTCVGSSGMKGHSPSIAATWEAIGCTYTGGYYNWTFAGAKENNLAGYHLNVTDSLGGRGTQFYPQSLVYPVQNWADPNHPDPLPNYALSATNRTYTPRCMHLTASL
ncbi:hypothetical protein CKAH01_17983 [Colletotrichum kahawae]|uniref:Uncharacterized protein n=1 Tax=Colletotrichum kahawae TaxID=34407 RepID=A0AAD9Y9I7_COLKA|nr:hypothetical protein CKAH01_17983 [Colletotrichum kahawae]